jgi:hypothetical protein
MAYIKFYQKKILLLLPPYGFWGAPYEKMPFSVTRATDTPQKHPTIITSVT